MAREVVLVGHRQRADDSHQHASLEHCLCARCLFVVRDDLSVLVGLSSFSFVRHQALHLLRSFHDLD